MAHYFFDFHDGDNAFASVDGDGVDFPSDAIAKQQAVDTLAAYANEMFTTVEPRVLRMRICTNERDVGEVQIGLSFQDFRVGRPFFQL